MVLQYIDFLIGVLIDYYQFLDSLIISENVSWLGVSVAVTVLSIVIGSVLLRV